MRAGRHGPRLSTDGTRTCLHATAGGPGGWFGCAGAGPIRGRLVACTARTAVDEAFPACLAGRPRVGAGERMPEPTAPQR